MPEQDPKERIRNVNEVPLGYTPEMAIAEAKRCIQCKKPSLHRRLPGGDRHSRLHPAASRTATSRAAMAK